MTTESTLPATNADHQTYLNARRANKEGAAKVCKAHGSKDGTFPGIPAANKPKALLALAALKPGDAKASATGKKSDVLSDPKATMKKFNTPTGRRLGDGLK